MLKDFLARQAARFLTSHLQKKSRFDLKNPSPLKAWAADLISDRNGQSVTNPYGQSIWVYRCTKQWERVAQIPLLLKDAKGEDVTGGSIYMLLETPSPRCTKEQLLERMIQSFALDGEYFLLKEDGMRESGLPLYLTHVPAKVMHLRPGDVAGGIVQSWSIKQSNGTYKRVPAEGVIHDYFPDPCNPYRGVAPLRAASASIDADFSARLHNKFQMDRHGHLSGIFSFKDEVSDDDLQRLAKQVREMYEGKENAGKAIVAGNGAQYSQLSMSAKDMDWQNGQNLSREEICAAFGISTIVAGGLMGATFSNYEMAMRAAWDEVLMPLGNRIASKFNSEIIQPNAPAGQYLEFDFKNNVSVLQDDEKEKVDRYTKLVKEGKVTPTQAATLTQIDLGEPDPAHDVVWINASEMPADFALEKPEPIPAPAPKPEPKSIGGESDSTEEKPVSQTALEVGATPTASTKCACDKGVDEVDWQPSTELQHAMGKANLRQIKQYERKIDKTLKAYFYDQRSSILEQLEKNPPPIGKSKSVDDAWVASLFAGADWGEKLRKRVRPLIEAVAGIGVRQVIREGGGRFEPVLLDNYVKTQLIVLNEVNATTAEAVKAASLKVLDSVIAGGIPTSELMDELKESLKGVYNNTESRRRAIARTETTRAWNGGRYEQMQYMGAPQKQWLAIMDGNVRDSHAKLDGKIVEQDAQFPNDLLFPGDPAAPAGETVNCRCTLIPIF